LKEEAAAAAFPQIPFAAAAADANGCAVPQARHFPKSGIFDKMSSSGVIKILHNLTFRDFSDFFAGGAERRPVRFEREIVSARRADARLAARQKEVRYLL